MNDWQKVEEILAGALDCAPAERAAYLEANCAGDAELRKEIQSLLAEQDDAAHFLESSVAHLAAAMLPADNSPARVGSSLGAYKIIKEIGRGGMGVVYLAAREDAEFRQRVALKLVKRGLDTEDVLRRFRNERQILASLHHPNIASLLDGGTTPDGLPYFVMEYIEGVPLLAYCDEHDLTTKERLELFRVVCAAVQHAHQNLVIHRDLKPSNIFVTYEGAPKLLDFGVAKFLNPELMGDGAAGATQTQFRVMTPDYASPEQARGGHITTTSDVYSLGVILYELLTGFRPYRLKNSSPDEVLRAICDSEPPPPSLAAKSSKGVREWGSGEKTSVGNRSLTPLLPYSPTSLKGDLDNMVLMALRKEPSRRYKSAEQFSADIERYLNGLPVIARPNTFRYRASKFIQRNKIGVAATALVVLSLLAGLITTVWQARVARREKAKAESVNAFLKTILNYANPNQPRDKQTEMTVTDVLNAAAERIESPDLVSQPAVKAELQTIIGESYASQGRYDLAETHLRAALATQIKLYGTDSKETLQSLLPLASTLSQKGNSTEAEKIFRQALPILREEWQKGNSAADNLLGILHDFAVARRAQGDPVEAETLLREGIALIPQATDKAGDAVEQLRGTFALTLIDRGKPAEAEPILREVIANYRQLPVKTPTYGYTLSVLGNCLTEQKKFAEADTVLQEAEGIYRQVFKTPHLFLGDNLRVQAFSLLQQGKPAAAAPKIAESLSIYRQNSSPKYINYPTALTIQGLVFNQLGKSVDAENLLREAVNIRRENLPETHFLRALADGALGEFLVSQRRYAEAEPLLRKSYENLQITQSPESPRLITALKRAVELYEKWQKPELAAEYRVKLSG